MKKLFNPTACNVVHDRQAELSSFSLLCYFRQFGTPRQRRPQHPSPESRSSRCTAGTQTRWGISPACRPLRLISTREYSPPYQLNTSIRLLEQALCNLSVSDLVSTDLPLCLLVMEYSLYIDSLLLRYCAISYYFNFFTECCWGRACIVSKHFKV
jgi:hypothetical protein